MHDNKFCFSACRKSKSAWQWKERKEREVWRKCMYLMLGTISGVAIMVIIFLCCKRLWIKYINIPKRKKKGLFAFKWALKSPVLQDFCSFYPKTSKKSTSLTQIESAPPSKVYSSSIKMRKRSFKRRCGWNSLERRNVRDTKEIGKWEGRHCPCNVGSYFVGKWVHCT